MNRALVRLLQKKERELCERDIAYRITGVATRRLGWLADANGLDLSALGAGNIPATQNLKGPANVREWLREARADVLFEATSLDPHTGQPAIDHIRAALETGAHAITANKGPIVHGEGPALSFRIYRHGWRAHLLPVQREPSRRASAWISRDFEFHHQRHPQQYGRWAGF